MKKTMLFSSALVALAMLASCQKEELFETPATTTGVTEFTATIGQPTKTVIGSDGKVTWEKGDKITVTDAESKSAVYVATSSGATTTFTLKEEETAVGAGPYTATYGDITKQKYSEAGANCPLEANTADAGSKTLHFSSPYAVVKVTAESSSEETVKTVVVKYGNSSSILDCSEGVKLTSGGVDFYVAVRPATNAALSVSFYTADKMATKTRTEPISLAAKDLLSVTFESLTWSPQKTFKAVYNTNGDANTLTFYYDTKTYGGEGITVYDNLPAAATTYTDWGYDNIRGNINSVVIDESVADYPFLTSTAFMFFNMTKASSISGAKYLDVSNVTNMSSMFNSFGKESQTLTDVPDVSSWNTGNVENMQNMFYQYGYQSQNLEIEPKVSKWNTGEVENMTSMFSGYGYSSTKLTDVPDVSKWKTDKVEKMGNLFANYGNTNANNIDCKLDLTEWNLASLTSGNVFNNFNPKTFVVTIPAKTGKNANQPDKWYGSGTYSFAPPTGKYFIPVLIGVFTVSDEKKVRFSQGNLWYGKEKETDATSTWYFETNQYDVQSSFGDVLHVGHFFWSKSDNVAYDTSYNDGSAATDDVFFTNKKTETEETAKTDFTSSGKMGFWRTLSQAEWQYLLEERTMTNGKDRYSNAMEDGVTIGDTIYKGIFLYPDNYNGDIVSGSMTLEQINAAGIVFLPSTGYRNSTFIEEVSGDKISCIYWTSTADSDDYDNAYRMFFQWNDFEPDGSKLITNINDNNSRGWAVGIRLVTDIK